MERLTAIVCTGEDGTTELCSPRVGTFRSTLVEGDAILPGRVLGELTVLRRRYEVVAPSDTNGVAKSLCARIGVQYCQTLVVLGEAQALVSRETVDESSSEDSSSAPQTQGIRAPIGGIFYGRPSPDEAAFVSVGDKVTPGQTLALLEVMKTFNPVRYEEGDLPSEARIVTVRARDGQEVTAGEILFEVGPV